MLGYLTISIFTVIVLFDRTVPRTGLYYLYVIGLPFFGIIAEVGCSDHSDADCVCWHVVAFSCPEGTYTTA
jgi:hypothetical protein